MKKNEFESDMTRLANRNEDIRAVCDRIINNWKYDLAGRKVGEAYQDDETGNFTTELDMACFLAALADRRAAINLPEYKSRRAATKTEGEIVLSKENRHGRIIGITSNADVFSFNVMIDDMNVMTASSVGKARNFMLQDITGEWHPGWKSLEFLANTPAEEKLFSETDRVEFKYFIHPNRWTSMYSRAYLLAKVAEQRLQDQDRFLKSEVKRIKDTLGTPPVEWPHTEKVGSDQKVQVWGFNAEVDGVDLVGEYTPYPDTNDGLEAAQGLRHRIGEFLRTLRFHIRATEFAFWSQVVVPQVGTEGVLGWLQNGGVALQKPVWCQGDWQTGWKATAKARTFWAVLEQNGVKLRFRAFQKTEHVAAEE